MVICLCFDFDIWFNRAFDFFFENLLFIPASRFPTLVSSLSLQDTLIKEASQQQALTAGGGTVKNAALTETVGAMRPA
jgi:hypothetical protein